MPFMTYGNRPNTPKATKQYRTVAASPRQKLGPRLNHKIIYLG